MLEISETLDRARVLHGLRSDYKLALVMGVKQTTLTNYRQGKTLPDVRVLNKISSLSGDDPHLLALQIESQRAKDDETRAFWAQIAERLTRAPRMVEAGFAHLGILMVTALMGILLYLPVHAQTQAPLTQYSCGFQGGKGDGYLYYVK